MPKFWKSTFGTASLSTPLTASPDMMDYSKPMFDVTTQISPSCSTIIQHSGQASRPLDCGVMQQHFDSALDDLPLYTPSVWSPEVLDTKYLEHTHNTALLDATQPQPFFFPSKTTIYQHSAGNGSLLSSPSERGMSYDGPPTPSSAHMIMPYAASPLMSTMSAGCSSVTAFSNSFVSNMTADEPDPVFIDECTDMPNLLYEPPPGSKNPKNEANELFGFDRESLVAFPTNDAEPCPSGPTFHSREEPCAGETSYPSPSAQDEELDPQPFSCSSSSSSFRFMLRANASTVSSTRGMMSGNNSPQLRCKRKLAQYQSSSHVPLVPSPKRRRVNTEKGPLPRLLGDDQGGRPTAQSTAVSTSASASRPDSPRRSQLINPSGSLGCSKARDAPFKNDAELQEHGERQHKRPFVCIFGFAGCDADFTSKNEWKRHILSQHLLLNYWVCTLDQCAETVNSGLPTTAAAAQSSSSSSAAAAAASSRNHRTPSANTPRAGSLRGRNSCKISPASTSATHPGMQRFGPPLPNGAIFNRKDLYTQHVRRMHTPQYVKAKEAERASRQKQPRGGRRDAAAPPCAKPDGCGVLEAWEARVKMLQLEAEKRRCELPASMRCPAAGCGDAFHGPEALYERMEHMAKHFEAASRGEQPPVPTSADADPLLVSWASHESVAIVINWGGRWVLNNPLKPTFAPTIPGIYPGGDSADRDADGEMDF